MKTIGIIGGLSPESTMSYYQWLNDGVRAKLGGHHSAKIKMASVDFGEFVALKEKGDWDTQGAMLCEEAKALERAGADFIILATNTMHKMADQIEAALNIPFLHLADATARVIKAQGVKTVGLLGTKYTMTLDFYKGRLEEHGVQALVPDPIGIDVVNTVIYDELCHGKVLSASKTAYQDVIFDLQSRGAEGVILGCTEITLLIQQADVAIPVFDTTRIHVEEALRLAFEP